VRRGGRGNFKPFELERKGGTGKTNRGGQRRTDEFFSMMQGLGPYPVGRKEKGQTLGEETR